MKTRNYCWLIAAALILVGSLSATRSLAEEDQVVEMRSMFDPSSHILKMDWYVLGKTQPVKFELYHYTGFTSEAKDLTLYSEITPDSTIITEDEGLTYVEYSDEIVYEDSVPATIYVKATWADGSVKLSQLDYIGKEFPNYDYVIFNTEPITTAKIGETYIYDADASSQSGKEIIYSLLYGPQGAQIDQTTGKVTWTPTEYGRYDFQIYATTPDDDYGYYGTYQSWAVRVNKCENLSTVSGTVKDQDGNLIGFGYAELVDMKDSLGYLGYYSGAEIQDGKFEIKGVDEGSYYLTIYIKNDYCREPQKKAVTVGCNENKTLDIEVTTPNFNNQITINSLPTENSKFGETYTYDVNASAPNSNLEIKYRFNGAPDGATIDENTGLITWNAEEPGIYYFSIEAYAEVNEEDTFLNGRQSWMVRIIECETPSTLNLAVKFDNDSTLQYGTAYLVKKVQYDSCFYNMIYDKAEVKEGTATFGNLDKGSYFLMVEDYGCEGGYYNYYQHWYENAFDISDATPIVIDCGVERSITMTLTAPPKPNYYTVRGRVTDSNGDPVKNASVEFCADGRKFIYYHETSYQAYTDENGYYSISAADDQEYYAVAYISPDSSWNYMFYPRPIYYNQTTDPSEAELINLTGDRNDINFVFPEIPHFENSVSGKITDENDVPIANSFAVLYLVEPTEDYTEWLYSGFGATTNSDGTYEATNLIPGNYIAFTFSPDRENFIPGYYKQGEPSTQNWEDATLIAVGATSDINDINIKLGEAKGIVGIGTVNGKVFGDEKKQIVKGSGETDAESPIAGANVYAINEKGEIAGSAQTASDGGFLIKGLSKGNYTLNIDKVGYELSNVNITLNDDNSKSNADVNIRNKGIADRPELTFLEASPNPVKDVVRLNFQADGATNITLLNSLGQKVYSLNLGVLSGKRSETMNFGSLPQGAYYLIVESGPKASVQSVIIVE